MHLIVLLGNYPYPLLFSTSMPILDIHTKSDPQSIKLMNVTKIVEPLKDGINGQQHRAA
jgi:hypothetical protein